MKNGKVALIYNKSSYISANINYIRQFRFCPVCMKEDFDNYGETYWHRLHQVTGVLICPKHRVVLQDSTIFMRGAYRQIFISADENNCITKEIEGYPNEVSSKLMLVAEDIQKVFNHEFSYQNINNHKYIYAETY